MKLVSSLRRIALGIISVALSGSAGCVACNAIPASRVPASLLARPRADKEQLNLIKLRQDPPAVYQLGPRDILGIYIEGVLGQSDSPPPVHFPERESNTPPAIGYPIPVREDGTLALPLIKPIKVSGLTLTQAEDEIRRQYIAAGILLPEKDRIIVTLIRKRTYQVLVVREDLSQAVGDAISSAQGQVRRGASRVVDLKAYENDVLHALSETGGLPGLDAKNEVRILRGAFADATGLAELMEDIEDGEDLASGATPDNPNLIRIPLRRRVEDPPVNISEEDIILGNGDIVLISTREREVFYTGGVLYGREILLPRDYDLDVLGAIAMAGASIGSGPTSGSGGTSPVMGGGGGNLSSARGLIPPTQIIVVRKTKGGYQIPIKVSTTTALSNPGERILIQPGDLIILQYTTAELIGNILLNNIQFNYFLNKIQ
ncbi:MAG: polysaccharide biosynthesis/export family protein [Planctomycetes bacterium]|nr:polysaccharide biosynthesis/export family protein [Planctomycetota bacterium]